MTTKSSVPFSLRRLEEEASRINQEVSSKFVREPSLEELESDLLIALKRFNIRVRTLVNLRELEEERAAKKCKCDDDSINCGSKCNCKCAPKNVEAQSRDQGLGTGLYSINDTAGGNAMRADENTELFLNAVARDLLGYIQKKKKESFRMPENATTKIVNEFISSLKRAEDDVFVQTDKTNSRVFIKLNRYIDKVIDHLNVDAMKASKDELVKIRKLAKSKLEEHKDLLSAGEYNYIATTIARSGTPVPRLLVKDHKDRDENDEYPTRLVVPADGFTAAFPHVGMKGLRHVFDRNKVEYQLFNIEQASSMKNDLEKLGIKKTKHGFSSIDAEKMYPSIKFGMIKKQ